MWEEKRQEGNVHATTINSPIRSIPSLLCLHSGHSPICRTHFIPAHLRQRYIAGQFPYSCQNSLTVLNFQLARKLIRAMLSYLHQFYIPQADCLNCFLWEEASSLGSYIRLLIYSYDNTCSVTLCELQQYNAESQCEILSIFRCAEPVKVLLLKKKNHSNSLKSGNASEEERCILAMYFITIIVPDAIWKKIIATDTKFLKLAVVYCSSWWSQILTSEENGLRNKCEDCRKDEVRHLGEL